MMRVVSGGEPFVRYFESDRPVDDEAAMMAVDIEPPSSAAFLSRHRDLVPDVNNPYPVVAIPNIVD